MSTLRIVTETELGPLDRERATATVHAHWSAARTAYAAAIRLIGAGSLPELVDPRDRYSRVQMAAMRDHARRLQAHVTRLADELTRAADTFDRYDGSTR